MNQAEIVFSQVNNPWRMIREKVFKAISVFAILSAMFVLFVLLAHVVNQGWQWLSFEFLDRFPSRFPHKAGLKPALFGTLWVIGMTALWAVPLGVASAIFLEEYSPDNRWTRIVKINIANLAGMPSIIYGLLGLAVFVRFFKLDRSVWAGSLTLALLVLPIIVIAAQEAIRAVPTTIRDGAYAMGARKWNVVFGQVLPAALPGIMTGVILALSRAIGETAPLIMVGALSYVAFVPEGPSDPFTALPIQIFNWAGRPQEEFHEVAAAGIIVLLAVLFSMNLIAVLIREKFQRYKL